MCTSQFEIQRGVRQGDPMSPYLFIIVAEVLATAIRTTNIQSIKIGKEEFKIVQYADDLTVFCLILKMLNVLLICWINLKPVPGCRLTLKKPQLCGSALVEIIQRHPWG